MTNVEIALEKDPNFQMRGVPDAVKLNQLQNLLHDALIATGHVQSCAIIRRKDASLLASSVGFNLFPDQIQMLLDAFKNPPQTREEGLYFEDKQYKCVRADKNSIYAKQAKRGLVLVRTGILIVLATYTESMFPSVCVEAVEKLGLKISCGPEPLDFALDHKILRSGGPTDHHERSYFSPLILRYLKQAYDHFQYLAQNIYLRFGIRVPNNRIQVISSADYFKEKGK